MPNNEIDFSQFEEDILEFEPYETLEKNFMHWFKPYMNDVFKNQTKRLIKDKELHKTLIIKFNSINEMNDLRAVINEMSKNGFKGPKNYYNCNKILYDFLLEFKIESLSKINSPMLKYFLSDYKGLDEYSFVYKRNIYVLIKNFLTYIENKNTIRTKKRKFKQHNFKLTKDIIKALGKEKKNIAYLTPHDEYFRFLDALEVTPWQKSKKLRNALMLKLILVTGVRVSELTSIKLKDIEIKKDINTVNIIIIGKGNKKRIVNIALTLIEKELEECMYYSREIGSEFLFSTANGVAVNDRYVNTLVVKVMEVAKIAPKEKNGPHLLRHSAATFLSAVAGFDIAKLQVYMAHEDIQTTKKYVHLDTEVVKEISTRVNEIIGQRLAN
jgi:integrase/recombinase XerD